MVPHPPAHTPRLRHSRIRHCSPRGAGGASAEKTLHGRGADRFATEKVAAVGTAIDYIVVADPAGWCSMAELGWC